MVSGFIAITPSRPNARSTPTNHGSTLTSLSDHRSAQKQSGACSNTDAALLATLAKTSITKRGYWSIELVVHTQDEFDIDKAIWTIPKERMKASVEHRVPLGKRALRILEVIKPFSGKKFVFKTGKKDAAMSTMGMAMLLRRMEVTGVTVHGMRSTFRNWAGEKTNYSFQVCEQALAHSLPDAVAAAYLRSDFFVNRVNLMQDWEKFARSKCTD